MSIAGVGYNSERRDPVNGSTHLSNGYCAYNPHLMRFNTVDSWSPFGGGGINPYAYCAGDPVNRAGPSGHIGGQGMMGIVTGVIGNDGDRLRVTFALNCCDRETLGWARAVMTVQPCRI